MRIFFIPVASTIAALSLFSASAFAATTPDATTASSANASEAATACLIDAAPTSSRTTPITTAASATTATSTPTTTAAATTVDEDDASATAEDATGRAIRACIAALHAAVQHGIGQTISELAHALQAERQADRGRVGADDDSSPLVSVTPATVAQDNDQKPKSEHGNGRGGQHGHD